MASTKATAAGIYVRISADLEGTGLGVRRQREDCEVLAKRLGWHVISVYEDNDVSATRRRPRPQYTRMMEDVSAGRIRGVVVWDVDRLTRTPRELEDVIEFADRMGLRLASVGGEIDLGTEQGRLAARMKGSVARYEVEQTSRRLKRKHAELAASGRHNGPRPFGWDFVNEGDARAVLRVNDAEAAVLRECVDRVLSGEGLWRIRNDLNARGVTTSTGVQWQTQTLRRVLLRWRNCGVRMHAGKEVGRGQWDPIIDRETHERVVTTLTDPSRKTNNRGTELRYLLTNIARCGACERPVVGTAEFTYQIRVPPRAGSTERRTRQRAYPHLYKCPHAGCMGVSRRMADVDEVVEGVVLGVLARDGVRGLGGDPQVVESARERIEALEAKLALTADQFADDRITAAQMQRITAKIRPQLDAEHVRLRSAMPDDGLHEFVDPGADEAWRAADVETRRQVLGVLGLRVTLEPIGPGRRFTPESVHIEWVTKAA